MNIVLDTSIISICATIISGLFIGGYKFIRDIIKDLGELKKEVYEKISEEVKTNDAKIVRVYSRLDEHKNLIETKFVTKDVCQVLHENTASNLSGLESRITANFDRLEKKIEDTFKLVLEKIR